VVILIPLLLLRFSSKYNYQKGLEAINDDQIALALSHFDRAIKEFGSHKNEASLAAIKICYERGYIRQGIAFSEQGISYIHNKYNKGNLYYKQGLGMEMLQRYDLADNAFKEALALGYQEDSVYIHLAMIHGFEINNYNEALSYLNHLVDNSGISEFRLQRGITLQNMGQTTEALSDLSSFVEANPDNGHGHFFLGVSLSESGRIEEACQSFTTASGFGIEESDTYLLLYCIKN
jgi:tetratricopeptide (TPR) repeat protein